MGKLYGIGVTLKNEKSPVLCFEYEPLIILDMAYVKPISSLETGIDFPKKE
jgi:hypothetical protein